MPSNNGINLTAATLRSAAAGYAERWASEKPNGDEELE